MRLRSAPLVLALLVSCSSDKTEEEPQPPACALTGALFEVGDPNGHPEPFGARAAKQARASRIKDAATYPQPAHGRQRVESGDFVLINDRIAVVIEDKGLSDGYGRFGGEILAVDRVGDDGKPMGLSKYNETLYGIAFDTIKPTSVSVLKDGSDGGEAIVRATGPLATVPFVSESFKALYPNTYDVQFAFDYVLTPGSPMLSIRYGVINAGSEDLDFGVNRPGSEEFYGFFQGSQSQLVTAESGFGKPKNTTQWAGFDGGAFGFAWRTVGNPPMSYGVDENGFSLFTGEGFVAKACSKTTVDRVQVIGGGPEYDGLREAVREVLKEPAWRAVSGTLKDAKGRAVEGAWIHGVDAAGAYLTRTRTAADGSFSLHAPPGAAMKLVPQKRGYPVHAGSTVASTESDVALAFAPEATLHITATDPASKPIPVRVQVIPKEAQPATPAAFGVLDEVDGRLYQEFVVTGDATLPVPPGEHRIIVSRGYEWELFDTTVTANAGEISEVKASLAHSVDSTGVMCADFHIHSMHSADSNDPVVHKVKGAIADGLDIPVSSEHEWVTDFQPEIVKLGLTDWAFGMASSELTTFTWGHFGVLPLTPSASAPNNGAVEWVGQLPKQAFETVHARAEKPILIVNHPRNGGSQGYFASARYDRKTNKGDERLWDDRFEAIEVFNDSDFDSNRNESVADWFAFLDLGRKMVAVGSSDSHQLRTSPVGYPRTCMFFGHDDPKKLSPNGVRDVVASGNATISGGLFMTVAGPGGERPGQTVNVPAAGAEFTVTIESPSWIGDASLETIVNGKTISTTALTASGAGPSKRYVQKVKVSADAARANNWVVFHAKGAGDLAPLHPGRRPFAVSNAVYLAK